MGNMISHSMSIGKIEHHQEDARDENSDLHQMCIYANLIFKFAPPLQWLFYYLCNNKFALHIHTPLHMCKFDHPNWHKFAMDVLLCLSY